MRHIENEREDLEVSYAGLVLELEKAKAELITATNDIEMLRTDLDAHKWDYQQKIEYLRDFKSTVEMVFHEFRSMLEDTQYNRDNVQRILNDFRNRESYKPPF